jgi:hypothetical protein
VTVPKKPRCPTCITVQALVSEFFGGDKEKTALWFKTPSPLFGGAVPHELMHFRCKNVLAIVQGQLAENEPPDSPIKAIETERKPIP